MEMKESVVVGDEEKRQHVDYAKLQHPT